MRLHSIIAILTSLSLFIGSSISASAQTPSQIDSASYLMGIFFGSHIQYTHLPSLDFERIMQGMKDSFTRSYEINPDSRDELINRVIELNADRIYERNLKESQEFLVKNRKAEGVVETPSGLQYSIIKQGNQKRATSKSTVKIYYQGSTTDGFVFDRTDDSYPAEFKVDGLIEGMAEGLQLVGEGGIIEMFISSELAYGKGFAGEIEPGKLLIFTVEMVAISE